MEHKFECQNCEQRMSATEELFGTDAVCPSCSQSLVIPFPRPNTPSAPIPTLPPAKQKKKRSSAATLLLLSILFGSVYFCCGIFVIQPIGAIPDGASIVYWRANLRLPFICSADGLFLETSGAGVSLLGRGIFLGGIADKIKDRKIVNLPYSKTLYLWSTGGKEYDR
jgi:hypothetical protein